MGGVDIIDTAKTGAPLTVLNSEDLAFLNYSSIRRKRNRNLSDECIANLDPEGTHVVTMAMVHNDCEIRLMMLLKLKDREPESGGVTAFLDISFEEYDSLARIIQNDQGEWERTLDFNSLTK